LNELEREKNQTMNNENTSDSPHFISLNEAAEMTKGTRITFIPGVQALYAEALKNICVVKHIPFIRALHPVMGIDKDTGEDRQARLYELTSQTGLPTMLMMKSVRATSGRSNLPLQKESAARAARR
jgi:hypothetical protein